MRQLHFVGLTDDRQGLIFADHRDTVGARYAISVDEALLGVLEEVRSSRRSRPLRASGRPSDGDDTGAGSRPVADRRPTFPARSSSGGLSPREIQARLRAGRTVADVAIEAGVDDAWVERFAAPILAEQHAAIQRAADMVLERPRRGPSSRPLGQAVRRNLLEKGIRLLDDDMASCWSAFIHDGSEWVIRFSCRPRGRSIEAEWLADLHAGTVLAVNRAAAQLGYVAPPPANGPDLAAIDLTVRESTRPIRRPVALRPTGRSEVGQDAPTLWPSVPTVGDDGRRPGGRSPEAAASVRSRPRTSSGRVRPASPEQAPPVVPVPVPVAPARRRPSSTTPSQPVSAKPASAKPVSSGPVSSRPVSARSSSTRPTPERTAPTIPVSRMPPSGVATSKMPVPTPFPKTAVPKTAAPRTAAPKTAGAKARPGVAEPVTAASGKAATGRAATGRAATGKAASVRSVSARSSSAPARSSASAPTSAPTKNPPARARGSKAETTGPPRAIEGAGSRTKSVRRAANGVKTSGERSAPAGKAASVRRSTGRTTVERESPPALF